MDPESARLISSTPDSAHGRERHGRSEADPSTLVALSSRLILRGMGLVMIFLAAEISIGAGTVGGIVLNSLSGVSFLVSLIITLSGRGGFYPAGTLCRDCHGRVVEGVAASRPGWRTRLADAAIFSALLSGSIVGIIFRGLHDEIIASAVFALIGCTIHLLLLLNWVPSFVAKIALSWPQKVGQPDIIHDIMETSIPRQSSDLYNDADEEEYTRTGPSKK